MKPLNPEISVCVCTFKRPHLLRECLKGLLKQKIDQSFEIIVVDNDRLASAKEVTEELFLGANRKGIKLKYAVEPEQNISHARNRAISLSEGKYIACIDDDEYPSNEYWLANYHKTLIKTGAHGIFGPIVNIYPPETLEWMKAIVEPIPGKWKTGAEVKRSRGTGNLFFSKSVFERRAGPFDPAYGRTGGEDGDLTNWLLINGCKFYWCDEAIVYQTVESKKLNLEYHTRKFFQFGVNCSRTFLKQRGSIRFCTEWPVRILLGLFKILIQTFMKLKQPKKAAFFFYTEMMVQLGKIGYVLGVRFVIYK